MNRNMVLYTDLMDIGINECTRKRNVGGQGVGGVGRTIPPTGGVSFFSVKYNKPQWSNKMGNAFPCTAQYAKE